MVQLRQRKTKPSYASFIELEEDDGYMLDWGAAHEGSAGPSVTRSGRPLIEDQASESEFDPEGEKGEEGDLGFEDMLVDDDSSNSGQNLDLLEPSAGESTSGNIPLGRSRRTLASSSELAKKQREKTQRPTSEWLNSVPIIHASKSRAGNKTTSASRDNSVRVRPYPAFVPPGTSFRLTTEPRPFWEPTLSTMPSIDYRHVHKLTQAWSRSLFPGPAWELMEDIGWYKERLYQPDGTHPRPLTLVGVSSSASDLEILTTIDGRKYLPSPTADDESENWTPPPPVDCFFGPLGDQTIVSLGTFESVSLAKYLSTSTAQVFNVGGPAWGLDWCPMTDGLLKERNYHRYLAVATFPNINFSLSPSPDTAFSRPACLQLWSYGPPVEEASRLDANIKCEMILCVDDGPSFEIKWCPLPSHDSAHIESAVPKLGILAGVFTDGSLSIHSVPDPHHLRSNLGQDVEDPIYVHTKAIFKVFPSNSACTCLSWANSELLAVGCSNGTILVYHIKEALLHRKPGETVIDPLPYAVIPAAQIAIRSVTWARQPPYIFSDGELKGDITSDPTTILATSYSGTMYFADTRENQAYPAFRARDIPYCVEYAPYIGGVLVPEHDNLLKYYGLFPQLIGHGTTTLIANGPIWDISTSDFHPYVAVACSDGSVMTSCLMKNVRKAGSSAPILQWKAYQMDYNSHTNQYRMLDNFLPMELTERSQTTKNAKRRKGESGAVAPQEGRSYDGSGAWPAEVGVHRVAWHSGGGLHSAPLLASATASGLCRIEWMKGRGQEGINLYSMIQHLRGGETVAAKTVLSDTEDG